MKEINTLEVSNSFNSSRSGKGKTRSIIQFSLMSIFAGLALTTQCGCAPKPPFPCSPEEAMIDRAEEQAMVRDVLCDTSPRNMNNLPKAIPEFCTTLPKRRCCP